MTGEGNWTWLIPGRVPTLVDAGTGDARYLAALNDALGGATLAQVLVTHGHTDHASGAAPLAALMPQARFAKVPWRPKDARWPVEWHPIADGDAIDAGDSSLVALHTPGHAPDHLCFWHEATRAVFCGDLVVKGTTVWIPGNDDGDMGAYVASLERVLALEPERLYPAHGAVVDDPARLLRNYIDHRREREAQVLDALRLGDTTPDEMTARIYRGIREALVSFARESVTAHLRTLERDGRVRRDGDAWLVT
jgi:glyoxylase-like metal-dependent hydrolase (beta-lactamase superfamily II)